MASGFGAGMSLHVDQSRVEAAKLAATGQTAGPAAASRVRAPWRTNAADPRQVLPSQVEEGSLSLQQSFQGLDKYLRGKGAQGLADAKQRQKEILNLL